MQDVHELTGTTLSAVCFVRDYVELHFDGPILRILVPARITLDGARSTFPSADGQVALCALIGEDVKDVLHIAGASLRVAFSSSAELAVSLEKRADLNPEAVHFVPGPDRPFQIF